MRPNSSVEWGQSMITLFADLCRLRKGIQCACQFTMACEGVLAMRVAVNLPKHGMKAKVL